MKIIKLVDEKKITLVKRPRIKGKEISDVQFEEIYRTAKNYFKIEKLPLSKYNFWKLKDSSSPIIEDNIIPDEDRNNLKDKELRYKRLETIFSQKWIGIQAIIIDKQYMNDPETIKNQIDSYEKLGAAARKKLVDDPDNEVLQGIVSKYNQSLAMQFDMNLLMQQIRGILELKIENNTDDVDEILDIAQNVKLTKEDLTEDKLNDIKTMFGL